MKKFWLLALAGLLWPWSVQAAEVKLDAEIPAYTPVEGISGSLKSIGSDSMNNLMALWAEGFRRIYPNVTIEVEGKGSATAPPALIAGTADFGPMSREMKSGEIDEFEKKYGYKPLPLLTSIDVLAVYVHRDNPIAKLALPQVDAIFSQTRKLGHGGEIRTWGQLGLTGEWANQPISMYGRNSASGTYAFFKEHALGKGDYKNTVKEQPGSSSVVQGVASDKYAIGYSGIGYKTADVRAVPLAQDLNSTPVPAEPEFAYSGEYPMTRILLIYVNHKPGSALPPVKREFIRYIFSQQGQQDVLRDGYLPATGFMVRKTFDALGITSAQ
ncbi:MAG: PstS family phosphate ABC transporter substrate-binding protein [Planctomycetes bacterium]|nr:PstS family phosphate ABC transporter substrate-binding protein [Planctomycetota bacterium]